MNEIRQKLVKWYGIHKRELPWRETRDPYKIWLSEVILQQTRVDQGMQYYLDFCRKFPTVKKLALADEDEVLRLWQGLGYYSRARNLHAAAKQICSDFKGKFPENYGKIIQLKGVGTYTASAISSICYNEARAVVDGNVYRVLSRIFGIETPVDSAAGKKAFQQLADELLSRKDPGTHNQALMEFGALQCTPKKPKCESCPFMERCAALRKKKIAMLPVKEKKTKIRERHFNYLVFSDSSSTIITKRTGEKDIWKNLYEFPLLETDKQQSDRQITAKVKKQFGIKADFKVRKLQGPVKHVLSHQVLYASFFTAELKESVLNSEKKLIQIKKRAIGKYALPRLIENFVKESGWI